MRDWPEVIFERDKERSELILKVCKGCATQTQPKSVPALRGVPSLVRCALFLSHIAGLSLRLASDSKMELPIVHVILGQTLKYGRALRWGTIDGSPNNQFIFCVLPIK